jgi:mRNA-degrading endonuclease RelE of RelBE toxin-antitoxin system
MSFDVRTLPNFEKEARRLSKKHRSLKKDLLILVASLEKSPKQGEPLGNDFYKVRLAITSKGSGKSGGARIITCVKIIDSIVFLSSIYDKSEKSSITNQELKLLARQIKIFNQHG